MSNYFYLQEFAEIVNDKQWEGFWDLVDSKTGIRWPETIWEPVEDWEG